MEVEMMMHVSASYEPGFQQDGGEEDYSELILVVDDAFGLRYKILKCH